MRAGAPTRSMLLALAETRGGVLLTRELLAAGLSRRAVDGWVARGLLAPVRKGVWVLGGPGPNERQRLLAALRVTGGEAVASHWSAARLHQLPAVSPPSSAPIELTVPARSYDRSRHRLAGVKVHRTVELAETDVMKIRGLPVTAAARTLLDIAPDLSPSALARLVDEGLISGTWSGRDLVGALRRATRRPGTAPLRRVVESRFATGPGARVESHLELRAARALASAGPFRTQFQVVLGGRVLILDIAWPELRVAVECDGWFVRSRSRGKFDADRRKYNLLAANGWVVVHLTAAMSNDEMRAAVVPVLLSAAAGRAHT